VFVVLVYRRVSDFSQALALVLFYTIGAAVGAILLPSIMGVLGLGILFFLVSKRLLGIRQPTGDLLAIVIALIVGIGRLGCLFNGCCFGAPTHLPWGIHYPLGTPAHWLHFSTGQIPSTSLISLAVHPIQLYEAVFLLFAAAVMLKLGTLVKNKNNILLGFFGAYLLFRFFIEFIRDMTNVWWSVVYLGPLSAFQWSLLAAGVAFIGSAYLLKRRGYVLPVAWARPIGDSIYLYRPAMAVLAAYLTVTLLRKHLQPIHLIQLVILIPVCTLMLGYRLKQHYHFRLVPSVGFATLVIILLFAPFITTLKAQLNFTALTRSANNTGKTWLYTPYPGAMKLVRLGDENMSFTQFSRISKALDLYQRNGVPDSVVFSDMQAALEKSKLQYYGGFGLGRYSYEEVTACGGDVTTYDVDYFGAFGGLEKVTQRERVTTYLGARLAYFQLSKIAYPREEESETLIAPNLLLYGNADFRYVGLGGGVLFHSIESEPPVLPSLYLRLGPPKLYLEAGLMDRYFVRPEPMYAHLGIGGLSSGGNRFAFGLTSIGEGDMPGPVVYGNFMVKTPKGLRFQPALLVGLGGDFVGPSFGINLKVAWSPNSRD